MNTDIEQNFMFDKRDTDLMASKGISPEMAEKQLEAFRKGFPKMDIVAPATPERGIKILSGDEIERSLEMYAGAHIAGKRKFVPASGAASRMFRDLFDGLGRLRRGDRFRVKNRAFRFLRASDFPAEGRRRIRQRLYGQDSGNGALFPWRVRT